MTLIAGIASNQRQLFAVECQHFAQMLDHIKGFEQILPFFKV